MEIVPNIQSSPFGLKVRTKGPRPSICVRTFSLFTSNMNAGVHTGVY